MRFNVIIGNPPYQKDSGGVTPKEIYSDFIIETLRLSPDIECLITPTRWYNGSTSNMQKVRNLILTENTSKIVDFEKADDVFENTMISGGISYWLWNKKHKVEYCDISYNYNGNTKEFKEKLNTELFIRYKDGLSIINKVSKLGEFSINTQENFWKTFPDIKLNDEFEKEPGENKIKFIAKNGNITYMNRKYISNEMIPIIDKYKVVTGGMTPGGLVHKSNYYKVINTPKIIEPNEVFSNYYFTLGIFDTLEEAENFKSYMNTKLVRLLIHLTNNTTSIRMHNFRFVPIQDCSKPWTDRELYEKYGLNEEEIAFVEETIKEVKNEDIKLKISTKQETIQDFERFMNKPEIN